MLKGKDEKMQDRKYYHITENGLQRIEEFKDDWKEIVSIYQFVTKEDGEDAKK